jgi:hypothetical protein
MNYELITAETDRFDLGISDDLDKRIAFHQAGHAVAICVGNKQRRMPEVYFQIGISQQEPDAATPEHSAVLTKNHQATLEGGRLIQSLPLSFAEATQFYSKEQCDEYIRAFESDVINLLSGPIAEAKYVANRDDEVFNRNLISLSSLHFYGGKVDLDIISDYMTCFIADEKKRRQKLTELFNTAFHFVDKKSTWRCITAIADLVLYGAKDVINCEDIATNLQCQ